MTMLEYTLSKMTTDELVDVMVGRAWLELPKDVDSSDGFKCVIELLDKRMTKEQMEALEAEILSELG